MFSGALTKTRLTITQLADDYSATQKLISSYLLNNNVTMMNSFEMNRIASLSYNTKVCQEIFDLFESIINFPAEMTVLTLQKTLVLMNHLLLYGEELCVKCCWNMGRLLEELRTFNTALLNAKNQSFFHNLKGGSVDVGGPVRTAAIAVHDLLSDTTGALSVKRMSCADPNSLVPIGSTQEVVFRAIESNIATKRGRPTKSNLKKSNDGFGSGYNPNRKQNVVGAAHSLEEMLKTAAEVEEREMNKYYDDANDPRRRNVFASKVGGTSEVTTMPMVANSKRNIKQKPTVAREVTWPIAAEYKTEANYGEQLLDR